MRKNNDLLEILESLEKKIELKNPEHISNLAIIENSSFSGIDMTVKALTFVGIFMFARKSVIITGSDKANFPYVDLEGLFNYSSCFYGLGLYEFVFFIFIIIILYSGKSAYDEWNKDINNIERIKEYLKILNLKDYELKTLTLDNLQILKNILEQQDISEDQKQSILEFLEQMHRMF